MHYSNKTSEKHRVAQSYKRKIKINEQFIVTPLGASATESTWKTFDHLSGIHFARDYAINVLSKRKCFKNKYLYLLLR